MKLLYVAFDFIVVSTSNIKSLRTKMKQVNYQFLDIIHQGLALNALTRRNLSLPRISGIYHTFENLHVFGLCWRSYHVIKFWKRKNSSKYPKISFVLLHFLSSQYFIHILMSFIQKVMILFLYEGWNAKLVVQMSV